MKILVVSDTHGNTDRVVEVYRRLSAAEPIEAIFHCGDFCTDAEAIRACTGARVCAVRGNCDGALEEDDFAIYETDGGSFLITHGHRERVDTDMQRLYYKTLENGCVGACFGHTHRAVHLDMDGIHLLNPGSIIKPHDGTGGSFGLIEVAGGSVKCSIHRYDAFMAGGLEGSEINGAGGDKPKVRGGFLRGLLNYSDRF